MNVKKTKPFRSEFLLHLDEIRAKIRDGVFLKYIHDDLVREGKITFSYGTFCRLLADYRKTSSLPPASHRKDPQDSYHLGNVAVAEAQLLPPNTITEDKKISNIFAKQKEYV